MNTPITLATLHTATAQEVFDQVATHLLTQAKRSNTTDGMCAYRGVNGLKCAAGALIADDEYDERIEGVSWARLVSSELDENGNPMPVTPEAHCDLIQDLQALHDALAFNATQKEARIIWSDLLRKLAENYELNTNVIDNFTTEAQA